MKSKSIADRSADAAFDSSGGADRPLSTEGATGFAQPAQAIADRSPLGLSLFRSRREATVLVAVLLVLGVVALYQPAIHNDFINYDDPDYVIANAQVRNGLSWNNLRWALTATAADNWHPLTWVSHMTDVELFGLKPAGHHLTNVLLHALNVVLLFLLLRAATGYIFRSGFVAALFALFPLNVEVVAWVAERKSLLCTTFLFLALLAYGWYVRRPGIVRYGAVALLFALGLMAKPAIITFPFMLLLIDYWPLCRSSRAPGPTGSARPDGKSSPIPFFKLVIEKTPLFLLSLASAVATLYAQHRGGAVASTGLFPLGVRIENALRSYLLYLGKAVWPARLAVFYPYPDRVTSLGPYKALAAGLLLLGITWAVWNRRQSPYLRTGWLWYLGTLVPMIGIVQVGRQSMADRYAYVSFLGLFVILVWAVAEFAGPTRTRRSAVGAAGLLLLVAYAWVSHIQLGYWRNSYTLFSHAVDVTSANGVAEDNLAIALERELGRPDLAIEHYEAATRFMPDLSTAHYNLATALQTQNRLDQAFREYQLALAYTSSASEASNAHNNLGLIFLRRNQPRAALSEFDAALQDSPNQPFSLLNRAGLEYQTGNLDGARDDFVRATSILPDPKGYFSLGRVYEDQGNWAAAAAAYENSLKLDPEMNQAQERLEKLRDRLVK